MPKSLAATEVVRDFSELLSTIHFLGKHDTMIRGSRPVLEIGPIKNGAKKGLEELPSLPSLGDEAESFERDIKEQTQHPPFLPQED